MNEQLQNVNLTKPPRRRITVEGDSAVAAEVGVSSAGKRSPAGFQAQTVQGAFDGSKSHHGLRLAVGLGLIPADRVGVGSAGPRGADSHVQVHARAPRTAPGGTARTCPSTGRSSRRTQRSSAARTRPTPPTSSGTNELCSVRRRRAPGPCSLRSGWIGHRRGNRRDAVAGGGTNGWYTSPVGIGFSGSDQTSGVESCTPPPTADRTAGARRCRAPAGTRPAT